MHADRPLRSQLMPRTVQSRRSMPSSLLIAGVPVTRPCLISFTPGTMQNPGHTAIFSRNPWPGIRKCSEPHNHLSEAITLRILPGCRTRIHGEIFLPSEFSKKMALPISKLKLRVFSGTRSGAWRRRSPWSAPGMPRRIRSQISLNPEPNGRSEPAPAEGLVLWDTDCGLDWSEMPAGERSAEFMDHLIRHHALMRNVCLLLRKT